MIAWNKCKFSKKAKIEEKNSATDGDRVIVRWIEMGEKRKEEKKKRGTKRKKDRDWDRWE